MNDKEGVIVKWERYEDKKWDLMDIASDNGYEVINTDKVKELLPDNFKGYYENNLFTDLHVAMKIVGENSSGTVVILNINRIDEKDGIYQIDQDQWFLAWHSGASSPSVSGALYQHGGWDDRTIEVDAPEEWIGNIKESGICDYIPETIPIKPSGSIDELKGTSHWAAKEILNKYVHTGKKVE